jgi:cell wall-associated NlpC family hydrolase
MGRGIAVGAAVLLAGALAVYSSAAGAAPQPSLSQVKAQVNSLTARLDGINQHYDQVAQQLQPARGRLARVQREAQLHQARFLAARTQVAQIAAAAFEGSGQTSIAGLLTSGDPSAVLKQGSLLQQMAASHNAQIMGFLAEARQLSGVQLEVQRTEYGIAALRTQLAAQKSEVGKLLASKQATLDSLTTQQQTVVAAGGIGAGGTTTGTYTGPTSTQAEKAVAFAYAQLGKPYQWGATGPYSYDCSGLVGAAWASAGVSIPRDTYQQFAALPHIALSAIQPGDLLFYDGVGHVSMYVGYGYIIDAPQTGMNVQKIPMGTGWYAATFIGAARP